MNKNIGLGIAGIALVAIGIGAGFWLGGKKISGHDVNNPSTPAAAAAERKPLYYHDPMVPGQKFDKPGKSPFMDMMLVPVYADNDAGADTSAVTINSRLVQNLGIRTQQVTVGSLDKKIHVVGAVAFDERSVFLVQARVAGSIEKLFVRAPLDAVSKGQMLAEILAPDWVSAQEEYLVIKNSPQANPSLRQAARQRLLVLGVPDATINAIDADGKIRPRTTLTAPASGVIGELAVREGKTVMPGEMLFRINGLATVWVNADVPENQAAWLKPGSSVEVSVPAYPGDIFKGRVTALLPEVDANTRTLKARIEVINRHHRLVPGMFATISVNTSSGKPVILVPSEAVIQTGTRTVVVVAKPGADGKLQFTPVDVEIGAEAHAMTEIRSGLSQEMRVVLSGQFLIDSESSLKATGNRMGPASPESDAAKSSAAKSSTTNTNEHSGEAKVEAIGKNSVTLTHGPIPSLKWPGMTMEFIPPKGGLPAGIKTGNTVDFKFVDKKDGSFEITTITPKAGAPGATK